MSTWYHESLFHRYEPDLLTVISLRLSGAYSDLTIICGHFEGKVHKCIVCPQSDFFKKACESGRWKVSSAVKVPRISCLYTDRRG